MPTPSACSKTSASLSSAQDGVDARTSNSSLVRGVEVLTVLLKAHHSLGITQVADAIGLAKSTTHDLLGTLTSLGFVEQNHTTRRYFISPEIFKFLNLFSTEYCPDSAVRRLLRTHARQLKASIYINALTRHSTYTICASGVEADTFMLGAHGPAYTSACGKILIAQLDETEWMEFLPKPGNPAASPYATVDPASFAAELRAARQNGVAWQVRERDGVSCSVAAPLTAGKKPWTRAVGIALPYSEWVVRDRGDLAAQAKQLAAQISGEMIS